MLQCYVLMCARSVTTFLAPPRSQRPGHGPRSPHPKAGPVVRTHCLKDVDNNNVECTSANEYRLDYHRHRGLEAYHGIRS
jgi:hypothetical protein